MIPPPTEISFSEQAHNAVFPVTCPKCGSDLRCSRRTEAVTCPQCGHVYHIRAALVQELLKPTFGLNGRF